MSLGAPQQFRRGEPSPRFFSAQNASPASLRNTPPPLHSPARLPTASFFPPKKPARYFLHCSDSLFPERYFLPSSASISRLRKTRSSACGTCTTAAALTPEVNSDYARAPDVARGPSALKDGLPAGTPPFALRFGRNFPVPPVLPNRRSREAETGGRGGNYF